MPKSDSGQQFSKKTDQSKEEDEGSYDDVDPLLFKCSECNVKTRDGESFERHLKGNQHQRVMEILKQQHAKMLEVIRLNAKMEATIFEMHLAKAKGSNKPQTVHCNMCQLDVCGPMSKHRLAKSHQDLKTFLHPHCDVCNKSFQLRSDWDTHKYSKSHLTRISKKSGFQKEDDYVASACKKVMSTYVAAAAKPEPAAPAPAIAEKPVDKEMEELKKKEEQDLSEARIKDYVVPEESEQKVLGVSMVKPVNGYFCCVCKKFFASKLSEHCKTSNHYVKFVESIEAKKQKLKKRKIEAVDPSISPKVPEDNKVQKLLDE